MKMLRGQCVSLTRRLPEQHNGMRFFSCYDTALLIDLSEVILRLGESLIGRRRCTVNSETA
jgi:hypothetical protein